MIELAQEAVQAEIIKHPKMRVDILEKFDAMVDRVGKGADAEKGYANFIQYLDNYVRNQGED
jgi:hypothetical protein